MNIKLGIEIKVHQVLGSCGFQWCGFQLYTFLKNSQNIQLYAIFTIVVILFTIISHRLKKRMSQKLGVVVQKGSSNLSMGHLKYCPFASILMVSTKDSEKQFIKTTKAELLQPQFYIQLVYTAPLCITLKIKI